MNTAKRGRTATRGRGRGRPKSNAIPNPPMTSSSKTSKTDLKCPACQLVFSTESDVTNHKMTHSELYDYECGQCDQVFETMQELKNHFYRIHTGKAVDEAVVTGGDPVGVQNPVPSAVPDDDSRSWTGGNGDTFGEDDDGFNDDNRDGGTSSSEDNCFAEAKLINSDVKERFQCDKCAKVYQSKDDLTVHLRTHNNVEQSYICDECGKTFKTHGSLTDHLRRHNEDYKFFCEVVGCGKGFIKQSSRDRHELTHVPTSKRPRAITHTCNICGRVYGQKPHLTSHMMMAHSNAEKPFACNLCDMRFWKKSTLDTHLLSQKHGGPGVSYRNKKKPKKTNQGGVTRRGRKKKVPARYEETDQAGRNVDHVPPGRAEASKQNEAGNPNINSVLASAPSSTVDTTTIAKLAAPTTLPHQQPQQFSVISSYQQHQAANTNYWTSGVGQQSQQQQIGMYGNPQQQLLHVPAGVITLQDAFQMGYGIGGGGTTS